MALLTRPANVLKNTAANFVIDLVELAALPGVPTGYYKDTNNWKELFIKVTHIGSDQKSVIRFALPATTASLLVSDTARSGTWQIESILIRDFDRGEVVLNRVDIPDVASYDFFVMSAATHGDLLVTNGQTVTIPANATRQYGDIVIDTGGILEVEDGGGILTLEALGNCVINGTIKATNGKHLGGVWNKTSPLGESLSHTVTQKAGGNGGAGEDALGVQQNQITTVTSLAATTDTGERRLNFRVSVPSAPYSVTIPDFSGNDVAATAFIVSQINANSTLQSHGVTATQPDLAVNTLVITGTLKAFAVTTPVSGHGSGTITLTQAYGNAPGSPGGTGGLAAFGNGGSGGRANKFIAQAGDDAIDVEAGQGLGQSETADEHGENGLDSTAPAQTAGGGFRGAHGQSVYIKAARIQGSGTINASGQKGGNGGNGGEYLSEGELYANGPGGGAAGGDGGNVWLRTKKGTPFLTVNILGGERGTRGVASSGASEAQHGTAGSNGSYSFSLF